VSAKEMYTSAKQHYTPAKETYISAKEPYTSIYKRALYREVGGWGRVPFPRI